jgi:hypothetical protein
MRKLLGTLKVYETDEDCVSGLHSKLMRDGTFYRNQFELRLCPNGRAMGNDLEKTEQEKILAHELGHFVGHILALPEHLKDRKRTIRNKLVGLHPDARPSVPQEEEAWTVAEDILPGAKQSEVYKQGIASYAKHDERYWKLFHDADPFTQFMVSDETLKAIPIE